MVVGQRWVGKGVSQAEVPRRRAEAWVGSWVQDKTTKRSNKDRETAVRRLSD